MQIFDGEGNWPEVLNGSAVSIGSYDGVHRGHCSVLAQLQDLAATQNLRTGVVTFSQHPATVVRPDSAPLLLTTVDQKLALLAETGIDFAVVLPFDKDRSSETADAFVQRVLVDGLNAKLVVVGEDFHFGFRRSGNVPMLKEVGERKGFTVHGLQLVDECGNPARDNLNVSSTAIRRALTGGRLHDANMMLGRTFELVGEVVHGDERGRTIGFPTANLAIPTTMLIPAEGIYAGWACVDPAEDFAERVDPDTGRVESHRWHQVAIYIGHRPTFYHDDTATKIVEVHFLSGTHDLYRHTLCIEFFHRLRGERAFPEVSELVQQIQQDCQQARELLGVERGKI